MVSIIVAIGLVGCALILAGQKVDYQSAQAERQSEPEHSGSEPLTITVGEPGTYKLQYDASRQKHDEAGPLGLSAEWLIAIFTIVLSAATIWLAIATRGLWKVTNSTLQHAEVSSEREQRAYVFPNTLDIHDGRTADPPLLQFADIPAVTIVIQNTGATPAYDVKHWAQIRVLDRNDEHTIRPMVGWPTDASKGWMGRGGHMNKAVSLDRKFTYDELEGIRARTHAVFVQGEIEYLDAFKKVQRTTYRLFYMGAWPPTSGATMSFCAEGNTAT